MTETELQALCEEWQGRLFLRDWTVLVRVVSPREAEDGSSGHIVVKECHRTASLCVSSDFVEVKDPALPWWDEEHLIVHELIHLTLWAFHIKPETPEGMAEEQAVNALTRALIALKRVAA
jgi:hypothetical protein